MNDKEPTKYMIVEIDRWGTHLIYKHKSYVDLNQVRKLRDVKQQEADLNDSKIKYVISSIQPFL